MTKTLFRGLASLGLLALVFHFAGTARIVSAIGTAAPGWLALALAAAVAASIVSALRWHALTRWLGLAAPRRTLILAYFRGIAANTVLPGGTVGGDALRVLHLQRYGHPLATSAASVALDRMSGLWVLLVVALGATTLAQFFALLPSQLLRLPAGLMLLATLAALMGPSLAWYLSRAWHIHLPGPLERALAVVHDRPAPARHLVSQFAWSGLVQLLSILSFALAGRAVGLDLPPWLWLIVAGPVFVLAAVPVSVGGWGTREAAAAVTLAHFGASSDLAVASAVLYGIFAAMQGAAGAISLLWAKSPP